MADLTKFKYPREFLDMIRSPNKVTKLHGASWKLLEATGNYLNQQEAARNSLTRTKAGKKLLDSFHFGTEAQRSWTRTFDV